MARPIAVIGPTGTGKSHLALALAEHFGGEIVNADAMQQYCGMDIGTAKVCNADRRGIPHHQLDVLDVTTTATVARYQKAAVADVEAIAARGAVPVIVGGSMLYVQSLLDDWEFPATDATVRARWEARLDDIGPGALHVELAGTTAVLADDNAGLGISHARINCEQILVSELATLTERERDFYAREK